VIKNNLKRIGAIVLFAMAMGSCKDKNMEEEFDWSGNISAPKEYPMEVYKGYLSGGGHFVGFSELFSNAGWGFGTNGMSKIHAPAPDTLVMTWRSLVERKFYTGEWALPKDKMTRLFREGIADENPFSVIQLGLAPKGVLIIWLYGQGGQIEVGRFQGHETTIDPKEASDNTKYMFNEGYIDRTLVDPMVITPEIKEKIKQDGYPLPNVYDTYREKYLWKPKVVLPEGCKITSVAVRMCNGEKEDIPLPQKNRAIPYCYEIYWIDKSGQDYVCRIAFTREEKYWVKVLTNGDGDSALPLDFDKIEIRTLFKNNIDKNVLAEMVIKIDPTIEVKTERVTSLYLEQAGKQYPIREMVTRTGKY
jgi:hypothetical protein